MTWMQSFAIAQQIADQGEKAQKNVSDVLIPQDLQLSGPGAQHRPGARQPHRAIPERSRRQCHHRADLERHDRAQLLDRSEDRQ